VRLFYAAYLSQENMDAYQALVDDLIREVPGVLRSIPSSTHHLTLAFLGEIAESDVKICSSVLDAVKRFEAFDYALGSPSLLVSRGRPRLIRVSVSEGAEKVRNVQTALLSKLARNLSSIETRSKPPHITLARFKKNAHRPQARRVQAAVDRYDTPVPDKDQFSCVQLVKSELTPSGPIYETLCEVDLAGDP
jgi:2'-5' RNA ligase